MSITTIKVDSEVRDRLSEVARKRGTTMGALLDELSRQAEEAAWWAEVYEAYERLYADKEAWADYMAEALSWTEGANDGVWDPASAREDWPEYNS
jgi:hypothetical protein